MEETILGNDSWQRKTIRYVVLILVAVLFSVLLSLVLIRRASSIGEVVVRLVPLSEDASLLNRIPLDKLSSYQASVEKDVLVIQKNSEA